MCTGREKFDRSPRVTRVRLSQMETEEDRGFFEDKLGKEVSKKGLSRRTFTNLLFLSLGLFFGNLLGGMSRSSSTKDLQEIQLLEEKTKEEISMLKDLSNNLSNVSQEERKAVLDQDSDSDAFSTPIAPLAFIGTVITSQAAFFMREYQRIKDGFDPKNDSDVTIGEIVQYRLDYYLSTNPYAKALLLLNSTFLVILLGGMILSLTQGEDIGSALWESWTYVADPGTQVNAEKPGLRAIALALTVGGLVVFALMVGLITESVSEQVEDFRKGKSRVLEHGHTLILGFNDKCLSIIEELAIAFESEGGGTMVVLSDHPKEEMETILQGAVDSKERRLNLRGSQASPAPPLCQGVTICDRLSFGAGTPC